MLGDLAIEYEERRVTVGGAEVDLTATEFELLRLLSVNAGRVVHHDTILRRIWDGRDGADANLVRIFVRTLRQARRRRGEPDLDLQPARRRLPHAETRRALRRGGPGPGAGRGPCRMQDGGRPASPANRNGIPGRLSCEE